MFFDNKCFLNVKHQKYIINISTSAMDIKNIKRVVNYLINPERLFCFLVKIKFIFV